MQEHKKPHPPSDQPKRSKGDRIRAKEIEERSWALREQGYSVRWIAGQIGCSHTTVERALARVEDRIDREVDKIALRVLARDLAQLEHIQAEAMLSWQRSKANGKRVRKRLVPGNPDEVTIDVAERDGDAKFLAQALAAIESRRKLLVDLDILKRLDALEARLDGDGGGTRPAPEA